MIRLEAVTLAPGGDPLLLDADWHVRSKEHVGLVGRNGTGKTTLLRAIVGEMGLDTGKITVRPGIRLGWLPQQAVSGSTLPVWDEAASRMRAIVDDLLFMSRPVEKPQVHVDVAQNVISAIALLRAGANHLPVRLELDTLPPICGFASKLGQVFLNVLRNAAQAIEGLPKGEIGIRARVDGDFVTVVIADNGPGIPSDLLARVSTPFFTTKPQGMGLGLWISRALMVDQGGALELASEGGAGTTVSIRIPIA